MASKPDYEAQLKDCRARLRMLEEKFQWAMSSLDMIASLTSLQDSVNTGHDLTALLDTTRQRAMRTMDFSASGFLRINEEDASFVLFNTAPESSDKLLQNEVDIAIDNGMFAWAVQQNRTVSTPASNPSHTLVLHSLATRNKLLGMFVGLVEKENEKIFGAGLDVLSIVMTNAAMAWESYNAYNLMQHYNENLERQIKTRTHELEEAQKRAEAANLAKSAFLANMSHNLKTPLNAVLGYSEMLMEEAQEGGNEQLASDLNRIYESGANLLTLITDILDLAKIEAGKMPFMPEDFDIKELVNNIVTSSKALTKASNNKIETKIDVDNPTFYGDPQRIRQAIHHLISNALKFTRDGEVRISVRDLVVDDRACIEFAVSDTGIGIEKEHIETLFEHFKQLDDSSTKRYEGTGLGLAITKQICEQMQGKVWVESELGKGSTFYVCLPRVDHTSDFSEAV